MKALKSLGLCCALFFSLVGAHQAQAQVSGSGFLLDTGALYLSQSSNLANTATNATIIANGFAGAVVFRYWIIGWDSVYFSGSLVDDTLSDVVGGYKMGPRVGLYLNPSQTIALSGSYYPLVKATYTDSNSASFAVSGSSYRAELSYTPALTPSILLGVRLVYESTSYTSSVDSAKTQSAVTYTQTDIYPVLALTIRIF